LKFTHKNKKHKLKDSNNISNINSRTIVNFIMLNY